MSRTGPTAAVYSCDDHLDLSAVLPDGWKSRLARADAERGPRVEAHDGAPVWVCEGWVIGRSGMSGSSAGAKSLSAIGRTGIEDDGFRAGTPQLRLLDLRGRIRDSIQTPPSVLFGRQVMATFEEDALGAQLIPLLGADSCMWASDYPHTDSTFPNSLQAIDETLGKLPAADRRKITATNCSRLYGFPHVR